jgi:hypothetical protein
MGDEKAVYYGPESPKFHHREGLRMSDTNHGDDGEALRQRAHEIVDRLPLYELRAAIIALEELEVSVQVRQEWHDRDDTT